MSHTRARSLLRLCADAEVLGGTLDPMGSSVSTAAAGQAPCDLKQMVKISLPAYYDDCVITESEYEMAGMSWSLILTNRAPVFVSNRKDPAFVHTSCMAFFYETFYNRLFEVNPMARKLFNDVNMQGKFLAKMLTLSLSERSGPAQYEQTLQRLAQIHNELGVKAVEYGLMGEVLFWTLRSCVGNEIFCAEMALAWVKIYSRMLRTIIPLAVEYEMSGASSVQRAEACHRTRVCSISTMSSISTSTRCSSADPSLRLPPSSPASSPSRASSRSRAPSECPYHPRPAV